MLRVLESLLSASSKPLFVQAKQTKYTHYTHKRKTINDAVRVRSRLNDLSAPTRIFYSSNGLVLLLNERFVVVFSRGKMASHCK